MNQKRDFKPTDIGYIAIMGRPELMAVRIKRKEYICNWQLPEDEIVGLIAGYLAAKRKQPYWDELGERYNRPPSTLCTKVLRAGKKMGILGENGKQIAPLPEKYEDEM